MSSGLILRRMLQAALAAGVMVPASSAAAQPACTAGALSAYMSSAGLGCTVGNLRLRQFASSNISTFADQVMLTPFTMQGPPGYTWVGFTVKFGASVGTFSPSTLDFSFWSDGAPLHGLMADIEPSGTQVTRNAISGRVIGEGGALRVWNSTPGGDRWGCGLLGSSPESCRRGVAEYMTMLADSDGSYQVEAKSVIRGGSANDYTIAVLTTNAVAAPEPATMLLISTGLGGVGAMVRRRRRSVRG